MQQRGIMNNRGGGHPHQFGQPGCYPVQGQPGASNNNWSSTTQFINRAKQTALQQSGNHQLAALFANPGANGNPGVNRGAPDGFMRPPIPGVRLGMEQPPQLMPMQQVKPNCQCPNCSGGGGFQGPRSFPGPQNEPQQPRVMTFTSQLTGLPIPEHPSGLFPSMDFVMVPATGNGVEASCECGCGHHMQQQQQQPQPPPPPPPPMQQPQPFQFGGWNGPMDNGSGRYFGGGGNYVQMNSLY